jgi:hypothetical protein
LHHGQCPRPAPATLKAADARARRADLATRRAASFEKDQGGWTTPC